MPAGAVTAFLTVTCTVALVVRLPAVSRATAVTAWVPSATSAVAQLTP